MDAHTRLSRRVENYLKYRPTYPSEILPFLQKEGIHTPGRVVADKAPLLIFK